MTALSPSVVEPCKRGSPSLACSCCASHSFHRSVVAPALATVQRRPCSQKMGNSQGFDALCVFDQMYLRTGLPQGQRSTSSAAGKRVRIRGRSRIPCAPLPFSNGSQLNQLGENDRSHPGSQMEKSPILKQDTNNPELQLRMMHMLNSITQLTIFGFACMNFWIQNIATQREILIWHIQCRSSLSL